MTGEEIVLEYCDNIESNDPLYIQSCLDNARDIRAKKQFEYELSGCPSSYGLDEWNGLCFDEEVKGYKAQCEQCKNCWIQALEEEFDR
jgi:hypothetical protein